MLEIIGPEYGIELMLFVLALGSSESKYHVSPEKLEEERGIIEQAVKDPARFEFLYKRYHEQIFRFVYQRLDDKDMAFDITSQVFLKAMQNLSKYEFRGLPFSSWLYRVAMNELNQFFRKNSHLRTINIDSPNLKAIMEEDEEDNFQEHRERLLKALSELEGGELHLVEMRFFEQRAFKEIGEILDITENNAKVRLYRILDKLKKIMTSADNNGKV